MGLFDLFRRTPVEAAPRVEPRVHASGGVEVLTLDDPRLLEWMRMGDVTASGISVSVDKALKNTAMFRAVCLISYSVGMLPLQLIRSDSKEKATDHPLYRILHRQPNGWQTAFDFRTLMQMRALTKGNAYALVIRGTDVRRGRRKVLGLVPLDPDRVQPKQLDDWSVVYDYLPHTGGSRRYGAGDILHIRGVSQDGILGLSVVKQAAEAIGIALQADRAAARLFKNGTFSTGFLETPNELSPEAYERLRASFAETYSGADNAGKTPLLEAGTTYKAIQSSARDAQLAEIRKIQVEEIGRATGVPRPFLMLDDTSWGSGIEELRKHFVDFALGPWFEAWQQSIERVLLEPDEQDALAPKFNAGGLLRGSVKDQAEFFSKALGSGGAPAFMTQNEVRERMDLPDDPDGDRLNPGTTLATLPAPATN